MNSNFRGLFRKYLTDDQLAGFRQYKYNSIDTNPIGIYVMHPLWDWLIKLIPRWIAPNLITFVGFLFIVKSYVILSYYDYSFYASCDDKPEYPVIPQYVFFIIAFNIFTSYALDGIDGKQARRTGTSGPLGELFDHGLDSWTTVFIPIFLYSVFGRLDYSIPPIRLCFLCWNVFINFYLSHVEKYNTGVLYLPWSYDFSMLGAVGIFMSTYFLGYGFWKRLIFGKYSLGNVIEVIFYAIALLFNIPLVLYNILRKDQPEHRHLSFYEGSRPIIPLTLLFSLCLIWLKFSPTVIIERDPRVFCLLMGNIFSNICIRLIIAQMSKTRCPIFNVMLISLSIAILVSIFMPSLELVTLHVINVHTLLYHVYYGTCVVLQIAEHFNIDCFRIPYDKTHKE